MTLVPREGRDYWFAVYAQPARAPQEGGCNVCGSAGHGGGGPCRAKVCDNCLGFGHYAIECGKPGGGGFEGGIQGAIQDYVPPINGVSNIFFDEMGNQSV